MKHIIFSLYLTMGSLCPIAQVIPFATNEDGNIVIKGNINDTVPANFIFDTGGGLNVVSNKFFKKIKNSAIFQHYYSGFRHDGDRLDFEMYLLPSITIGNYKMQNVVLGVTSVLDDWSMDGIISLVSFENIPITIDYVQKQLRIETKSSLRKIETTAQVLPIKLHQFDHFSLDIFIPVCIDGRIKLDLEFDTGSSPGDIIINNRFLQALGIDTSKTKNATRLTPFSKKLLREYVATIDAVQYCGLQNRSLKKTRVDFKENIIYDGIIGAGYFIEIPFTIDIAKKRILVNQVR